VLATDAGPVRVAAVPIAASATDVLGVQPALGRFFTGDEDRPGSGRHIVLATSTWRRYFGSDDSVVNRTVLLDDEPFLVVGVMPEGFDFPGAAEAWIPLAPGAGRSRDDKELGVFARLAPGVSLARARADVRVFADRLGRLYPEANGGWSADVMAFSAWLVAPRFRDAVWMLFGAVGLLLLLVCVNIANILLAQATTREGELRIRAALGASRGRLARQMFAESALMAAIGTAIGVLVAFWLVDGARALGGERIPRLALAEVRGTVLLFAALAGALTCVMFGTAPALRGAGAALRGLDEGHRYTTGNRRLRHTLVAAELALAMLLLVGAGLLASSFVRLMSVDDGLDARGAVAMPIDLPASRYAEDRVADFYRNVLEQVEAMPGVTAAGATSTDPFRQFGFANNVTPEDRVHEAPPSGLVQAGWRSVTPGFFETLRIPVIAGRTFSEADGAGRERVVLVSRSLAGRLWPGGEAVGKRIFWGGTTGRTRTVIGVVGDIRDVRLEADPSPMLYLPHTQVPLPAMTVIARTPLDGSSIASGLREAVRRVDAGLPPPDVHEVGASRADSAAGPRFNLWIVASFAVLALILAMTGVYGTLAFTVAERRREIAVRLALGATSARVVRLVLGSGMRAAAAGIVAGLAGALVAARGLDSLLYGVAPRDPASFAAAATLLLLTAAAACYIPARRAAAVDPATVLRD
jgi:predicted permease